MQGLASVLDNPGQLMLRCADPHGAERCIDFRRPSRLKVVSKATGTAELEFTLPVKQPKGVGFHEKDPVLSLLATRSGRGATIAAMRVHGHWKVSNCKHRGTPQIRRRCPPYAGLSRASG